MENVRDWCISRQLWWGQRIPAYYLVEEDANKTDAQVFVGETLDEALEDARNKTGNPNLTATDLIQDEDVLDTWFSSGLWPITVFDGIRNPDNEDINYYYPTNDLVTAPEILFFWVARMVMYGYEYRNERPFNNVYLTGIVRDAKGRKMSKSLGNSPDPLELIKQYGADGVRTGMLFSSPAGNDLLFDIKLCEQGRNFSNKIWNAFRLVKGWEVDDNIETPEGNKTAIDWFRNRYNQALEEADSQYSKFRISDALRVCYTFTWNDFCSWYLEMIKPDYQKPIDRYTYDTTVSFFEDIVRLLHPFMPFITEEIWHEIKDRDENDCVIVAEWPAAEKIDKKIIDDASKAFELISQVRNVRNSKNIPMKQALKLELKGNMANYKIFMPTIMKLANLESFDPMEEKQSSGIGFIIRDDEFNIPASEGVDLDKEKESLEKELEYTLGFKKSVSKKLENERFVNNAPQKVVEMERKKLADAEARIEAIREALTRLNGK
jgi:valyl-tRNA synthetase